MIHVVRRYTAIKTVEIRCKEFLNPLLVYFCSFFASVFRIPYETSKSFKIRDIDSKTIVLS